MTSLLDTRELAGQPSTEDWLVNQQINFVFPVPTEVVQPHLPSFVIPKEDLPGRSLLNVGWMRLEPGMFGRLPAFDEITFSVHVQPDLALNMPMPRMSIFDFRIGSNSKEFLAYEADHQKLNGYLSESLTVTVDGQTVRASDDDGPIFELTNTHPEPVFTYEVGAGQYYSWYEGSYYQGVFMWCGAGFEHQHPGDFGRLYNHPFFAEVDVEQEVDECYMQGLTEASSTVLFRSFEPKLYREGAP